MTREHIKFSTIREDFNEYEIENGQILKVKIMLVDVLVETREDRKKDSTLGFRDFSNVITEGEIDTSNLEFASTEQITEKNQVKELKFKAIKEVVNIYETSKFLILVSPNITNVFLTNKKDQSNSPILRYTYGLGINTIDKSSTYQQISSSTNTSS